MKRFAAAAALFLTFACATTRPPAPAPAPAPARQFRQLSVALFPYIPDAGNDHFAGLIRYLTSRFQAIHPDILVTITMSGDPYDMKAWPTLFGPSGPNVVEVDTLTLGDLVSSGYVSEMNWLEPVFPFATQARMVNGRQYAIPTWVCMTFYYQKGTEPSPDPKISGVWSGSWMLPSYYLVAYTDKYGYVPLEPVMYQAPDARVVADMSLTMSHCTIAGANNCLNGTFGNSPNPGEAQLEYVQGAYDVTTGFSESSYYIFANGGTMPGFVTPLQLASPQNRPLAFTDGLVTNKSSCVAQCAFDAITFAQFLNTPEIRQAICFSEDAPGAPRRRLSPASSSFYTLPKVQSDRLYQQFESAFSTAHGFPNSGFPAARKPLQKELCTMLQVTIPDACKQ